MRKHLQTEFRRPIPDYSKRAFDAVYSRIDAHRGALVFDSYCGVGESTVELAARMPETLVVGIDKSGHRLDKHDAHYRRGDVDNYLLVRADVDDYWRQALAAGWRLQHHYLLYPNPWPKAAQLQRRCHGSPLFPVLLQLGGRLELRSNWELYLREFERALAIADHRGQLEPWPATTAITPFERKYRDSDQTLWRLTCNLT